MNKQEIKPDVSVENHVNIFAFQPLTERGREWIDDNVQDGAIWFGGALMVEHRYAGELANGMVNDGLILE
jgi:hypothetical protein